MAESCWVGWWWWCKCVWAINCPTTVFFFFFFLKRHSPLSSAQEVFFLMSPFSLLQPSLLLFFPFPSSAAKKSDIFLLPLSPYLSVSDEGRDLLSRLTVWAGLRVCSPSPLLLPPSLPPCLSACLAVLPHHTSAQTTKTPFAASERVPACPGIPTSGENSLPHCYALIACQVPFLFCSLVFLPLFFLIFSLCLFHGSFLCWQHPLCVFTLHSCPGSLNGLFLSFLFFFSFWLIFMNFAVIFCCFVTDLPQHTHTLGDSPAVINVGFIVTQWEILVTFCFYLHVTDRKSTVRNTSCVWFELLMLLQACLWPGHCEGLQEGLDVRFCVCVYTPNIPCYTLLPPHIFSAPLLNLPHASPSLRVNAFVFPRRFVCLWVCSAASSVSSLLHCLGSSRAKLSQNPLLHLLSQISPVQSRGIVLLALQSILSLLWQMKRPQSHVWT